MVPSLLRRGAGAAVFAASVLVWLSGSARSVALPNAAATPCEFTGVDRVVAVGDVHGAYDRFVEILRGTGLIDARQRWSGGKAHLVQVGDVLDRGPDSRKTLDFLQRLARDAQGAGGRVHLLLGNHEAMRLLGDFRYVTPGEYAAFATPESESLRSAFLQTRPAADREKLLADTPLGLIEMVRAFRPEETYGAWLRTLNAVVRINDVVYVHGGLSPGVAPLPCATINDRVRRELTDDLETTRSQPKTTLSSSEDGPLWYRGLAEQPDTFSADVDGILAAQHARAIVVGHTVRTNGRIAVRFAERVFLIDTGMQPAYVPDGRASALEVKGDVFTAVYKDGRQVLRGGTIASANGSTNGQTPNGRATAAPTPGPPTWPDARTIESRRVSAEGRRLFQKDTPLEFRFIANFKTVNGDMDLASTKTYPATVEIPGDDGALRSIAVQIRPRGHARRKICENPPLRIEFPKEQTKGTVFDGHGALKLGTHCKPELEDYVLREYGAYKIYNLLTPRSFRVRLARVTYVDARNRATIETRWAMFIEDDDDVAKRLSGQIVATPNLRFVQVDAETLTLMTLFEYMIGNTDMSLYALHNIVIVMTPQGLRYTVPYDFDYSGLVDATYAVPARGIGLVTVRDRKYRGPCRTAAELEPFFARTREARDRILALYDALPSLSRAYRSDAKGYLARYYTTIDRPADVQRAFLDGCNGRPYM